MSQEIYIDVNYLTESERDIVLQVLARDEELRRQEKRRISSLKEELDSLRKTGATKEEKISGKMCSRCRDPLGVVISSGALCPKCKEKVCNKCRKQIPQGSWLCTLCARLREVRAESGAWFYEQISRKKGEKPQLFGSALLRASIRRSKPNFLDERGREEFQSPPPPPVIKQELKKSGLHKPIPVHMSPLKEQTVEDSNGPEVNSNYKPRLVPTLSLPEDEEKPYTKAVPVVKDIPTSDDEEENNSSSSQSSRSSTPSKANNKLTGVDSDTSFHEASVQISSEELISVEVMSRKYDRHSSSSSESEKDDSFTSGKVISAEERRSGVEFENFLEHKQDQVFQSKEIVVESAEGNKAGKVLRTGEFSDNELQKGVEAEWGLNKKRANDFWLERKSARAGQTSESGLENPKCEIIDERVSMSLHLQNQVEQKRESSEVDGCLVKEAEAEDYEKERKTRSKESNPNHDKHEVKVKFPKAHRTVSWEYKTKDKEEVKWKEIDFDIQKVEERNDIYNNRNEANADKMKKCQSTQSEEYHNLQENEKPKVFGFDLELKGDSKMMQKKEKIEPSIHWEVVEIDIDDFSTEKETYRNHPQQGHRQQHVKQPDLEEAEKTTIRGYKEDVEETGGVGFEEEDKEKRQIDAFSEKGSDDDEASIEDSREEVEGSVEDSSHILEGEQTLKIEENNEFAELVEDDKVQETEAGSADSKMEQAIALDPDGAIIVENGEDKRVSRKIQRDPVEEKNAVRDELSGNSGKSSKDDDVQKRKLSKRMELLLENRKQTRQLSKDAKDPDLNETEVNKKSKEDKGDKEKGKVLKRVRWKDIEDHLEGKYGDVILSEEETEEKLVKHERMRKAELLLDRWQMKKQESEEQGEVGFSNNSEFIKENEEKRNSESFSENEIETKYDVGEPRVDFEATGEESFLDRTETRVEDLEDSGDFSYNYWQIRKKARIGRRVHKKDTEPRQNGISHEDQRRKLQLLRAESPDSVTTGEFFTPSSSPKQSGDTTPVPLEPTSDDDSQYLLASSRPEIIPDKYEVPSFTEQEREDESKQAAPVKEMTAPPTIVTCDATQDENVVVDGQQYNDDDIDQAFASYGIDLPSRKLGDQLNMGSRESIASYYSDAGDGVYGNVAVTGSVQFGLKYDKKKAALEVQIHSAREIAAVDEKKQRSDPYIKVYLLPDRTKGGKRKTKTKKHTLNPVFDEILTFKVGFDELLTRTLWLTVWNHDRFGHNEFLGEVMLPFDTYQEYGFQFDDPTPQWYNLCERRPEPSLMTYCGEFELALMYRPAEAIKDKKKKRKDKGELHIRLIGAKNLPAKDANGFSDPFCKSYLLPDKSKKTKQKTQVVKKNLNPVWNYSYVYENLTQEELMDRALELTVWDHDRGTSNDFLGGVRLCLGTGAKNWDDAQGEEIETWQAMLDHPNEWQKANLTLRSKMDSRFA